MMSSLTEQHPTGSSVMTSGNKSRVYTIDDILGRRSNNVEPSIVPAKLIGMFFFWNSPIVKLCNSLLNNWRFKKTQNKQKENALRISILSFYFMTFLFFYFFIIFRPASEFFEIQRRRRVSGHGRGRGRHHFPLKGKNNKT
jgi:hypothetical protein